MILQLPFHSSRPLVCRALHLIVTIYFHYFHACFFFSLSHIHTHFIRPHRVCQLLCVCVCALGFPFNSSIVHAIVFFDIVNCISCCTQLFTNECKKYGNFANVESYVMRCTISRSETIIFQTFYSLWIIYFRAFDLLISTHTMFINHMYDGMQFRDLLSLCSVRSSWFFF